MFCPYPGRVRRSLADFMSKSKSGLKFWGTLLLSAAVVFGTAEIALRCRGYNLECYDQLDYKMSAVADFMKPAAKVCGWGYFANDGNKQVKDEIHTGPDGLRVSRPDLDKQGKYKVAFFGCSWTFAMGVPDRDTMAYILNEHVKDIVFDNYGVNGFGTYQCYLAMENVLPRKHYDIAVYCYCDPQHSRTVDYRLLGDLRKNEIYCAAPYVSFSPRSGWHFFTADRQIWPGQRQSVLIDFLHRAYLGHKLALLDMEKNARTDEQHNEWDRFRFRAMYMLADRMQKLCAGTGTRFLVMDISGGRKIDFVPPGTRELPKNRSWEFLHVDHPRSMEVQYHVSPNDSHRNGIVQEYWAERFFEWLKANGYVGKEAEWN